MEALALHVLHDYEWCVVRSSHVPVNCWPSEVGGGQVEVNIEYELQQEDMPLNDVFITIPLP